VWALVVPLTLSPLSSRGDDEAFSQAVAAWDLAAARAAAHGTSGARKDAMLGIVAFHEGNYGEAERLLAEAVLHADLDEATPEGRRAREYLALARGSQRALGPALTDLGSGGATVVTLAAQDDLVLLPYLQPAFARARSVLEEDLATRPDHAVRLEILDDPAKLAMVSNLTLENVRTTGTVGITKHRRIAVVTPRVLLRGYSWIDTIAHEYVHYLVTLRTGNRAPVWLQEGLAKLLETRWRLEQAPALDPPVAALLRRAITRNDLVELEEMYPSIAMLPSQERAALAYAEVETMLGLLREHRGAAGISRLLDDVAAGRDAEAAFASAWGDGFAAFRKTWERTMLERTRGAVAAPLRGLEFAAPGANREEKLEEPFSELAGGRARQHARLGRLLESRGHLRPAASEYRRARAVDRGAARSVELARRLGGVELSLGRAAHAAPLLEFAARDREDDANLATLEARAWLEAGHTSRATAAAERAVRVNPFIPALHCTLAALATDDARRTAEAALCKPR
jgi:tetratricopeptide (TPR) repeat protein